ncbi:hypothetical protein SAMN04487967_0047 [Natronorubrum sediminis]|uniref:Uncharacterized protein n=1 Tax=Natronorubrum sediminis TaxID=640943 RepID=A0A1H6FLP7_9EURY|nr:hypothetical protein [Natronorubrum sediminis]SEH10763.1 hypothetical protein SAMN04487967_0047 [Natronorubrum sediminis]
MSLAADARRVADSHPFLITALRAGVVNYTAAARFLEVDGETDAVATALRRYAEELPAHETRTRDARVTMESGIGPVEAGADSARPDGGGSADAGADEALITVGGSAFGPTGGDRTAVIATGDVDATALAEVIHRLSRSGIEPHAAGVGKESLVVVVDRLEGANALRAVEDALESCLDAHHTL